MILCHTCDIHIFAIYRYVVLPCALDSTLAVDETASVYIARGELQRAEILLRQRATLRRTVFIGRPVHETYLLATGVLAIMQGRFEEGRNTLEELVPGEDQAHLLRGNTDSVATANS